ncbi:MAG: hypothetical protein R3293_15395 [Candidatus Promineifilaceae bacterium]|nr:hypothetical protein [Candidatus Promineifilaceae bacterium]
MGADNGKTMVNGIASQAQEIWEAVDNLFAGVSADERQQPHGPDWIFSDLPYHLGYIDQHLVARPLLLATNLPQVERLELSSVNKHNCWNDAQLAQLPAEQTVEVSLQQMHQSREETYQVSVDHP